jgi:hypothetical protein
MYANVFVNFFPIFLPFSSLCFSATFAILKGLSHEINFDFDDTIG